MFLLMLALYWLIHGKSCTITHDEARLHWNPDHRLFVISETGEERKLEFVVQPPAITKAAVGGAVLLPCVASGSPEPNVYWTLGDKLMEER